MLLIIALAMFHCSWCGVYFQKSEAMRHSLPPLFMSEEGSVQIIDLGISRFNQADKTFEGNLKLIPSYKSEKLLVLIERMINPGIVDTTIVEPVSSAIVFVPSSPPAWSKSDTIDLSIAINIPEGLPKGMYRIKTLGLTCTVKGKSKFTVQNGSVGEREVGKGKITVKQNGDTWTIEIPQALKKPVYVEAWLFSPDTLLSRRRLAATASYLLAPYSQRLEITLPKQGRWNSLSQGFLRFHIGGSELCSEEIKVNFPDATLSKSHKPISHGVYMESNQVPHYWHTTDTYELLWDGKPWRPFGGMLFVPDATTESTDRKAQKRRLSGLLDTLDKNGFQSLYVNMGVGLQSPEWYLQHIVDEFNERDITFGWQLTTGAKPLPAWEIYRSVSQGLVLGKVKDNGVLEVTLPKTHISKLLIVPVINGTEAIEIPFSWESFLDVPDFEIPQVAESQHRADFETARIDVKNLADGDYYVIVQVTQKGKRISNVWERFNEHEASLDWITRIDWGKGLRFFVDPLTNEGGMNNRYETIRVSSTKFESWYSGYLSTKYGSIGRLADSWALHDSTHVSFDQAARLIPMRDLDKASFKDNILLIDPETGSIFRTNSSPGNCWMDYLFAVRKSYADYRDQIAAYIKRRVNVPVVMKRVSPWVSGENISHRIDGVDGAGLELYAQTKSIIPAGGGSGRVEIDLSDKTMWLVVTELGFSAKPGNLGVSSWPSKESLRKAVKETVALGAKGIFLFGWDLPFKEWANHSLLNQPEQLGWVKEIKNEFDNLTTDTPMDYALAFPEGQSWWWRSSTNTPWTRYISVYDNPPSSISRSFKLGDCSEKCIWAISSGELTENANPIVVNFKDRFFAEYYFETVDSLINAGKYLIYLGHWPRNTHVPEVLSEQFLDVEPVTMSDGKGIFQPLSIREDDEVLAQDRNGHVWAKVNYREKLLIVSAIPIGSELKNSEEAPRYLNSEWLELFLNSNNNPRREEKK